MKAAQQMLKAIGYDPGREDGFFDEKTQNAIISLQKDAKIEANGVLSGQTTMALMERIRDLIVKNDTQINKAIEVLKQQMGS